MRAACLNKLANTLYTTKISLYYIHANKHHNTYLFKFTANVTEHGSYYSLEVLKNVNEVNACKLTPEFMTSQQPLIFMLINSVSGLGSHTHTPTLTFTSTIYELRVYDALLQKQL